MSRTIVRKKLRKKKFRKSRKKRNWRRIAIFTLILLVIAGVLGAGGYRGYHYFRRKKIITNAKSALECGDYRAASIHARRIFQLYPEDADASLIMAKIMETAKPEEAIFWRHKALEKRPDDIDNVVAIAKLKLNLGQIGAAQRLLKRSHSEGARHADFQFVSGQLALAANNPKQAEEYLLKAVELNPRQNDYQFALGLAELRLDSPEKRPGARERLTRLLDVDEYRQLSLQLLLTDMLQHQEMQAAKELSEKIANDPNSTFDVRLLRLEVLRRMRLPDFATLLQTLQAESRESNKSILELLTWLRNHNMSLLAIEWARTMPRKIASDPLLKLAFAECHLRVQDWESVKELTSSGDWGAYKFFALALQAKLFRYEGRLTQAQTAWNSAMMEAKILQQMQVKLLRLAQSWGWNAEAEPLLWQLTENPNPPDFVFEQLENRLIAHGDSESLCRLWTRKQALDPSDPVAANKLALLLLLRDENLEQAHKMAVDAYLADSKNPFFASTYAFSLFKQSKVQAALNMLSALPPEKLQEPSIAACYAAILIAADDKVKAREVLVKIKPDNLLPEGKRLLDESRNALGLPKS